MSIFSGILGGLKLLTNVASGGAGSQSNTKQSQTSTSKSGTTADRREFSDGFLQNLENITNDSLGSIGVTNDTIRSQIEDVQNSDLGKAPINFDVDSFVRGITGAATNTIQNDLKANQNKMAANTGGSAGGNTTSALLANRLNTDAAAQIAGITSQATAEGTQIASGLRGQQVQEITAKNSILSGLTGSLDSSLASLLNALKGGETFQTVDTNESSSSSGSSNTTVPFNWTKGIGNLFADVDQKA